MIFGLSVTGQLITFSQALGLGFALGFFYSILYFITGFFSASEKRAYFADAVFTLVSCTAVFIFFMSFNCGKPRLYLIWGMILGGIIAHEFPGAGIKSLGDKTAVFLKSKRTYFSLKTKEKRGIKKLQKNNKKREKAIAK